MKKMLEQGDRVRILPAPALMKVLQSRFFCSNDATRQKVADLIGGKDGVVSSIEEKWAFDYFYFRPDGQDDTYSIPYQAVDFSQLMTLEEAKNKVAQIHGCASWGDLKQRVHTGNLKGDIEMYSDEAAYLHAEAKVKSVLSNEAVRSSFIPSKERLEVYNQIRGIITNNIHLVHGDVFEGVLVHGAVEELTDIIMELQKKTEK